MNLPVGPSNQTFSAILACQPSVTAGPLSGPQGHECMTGMASKNVISFHGAGVAGLRYRLRQLDERCPQLTRLGKISACSNTGQEFVEVFTATHDGPFILPPSEVEDTLFLPLPAIRAWLDTRPRDFAPGFLEVRRLLPGLH